MCVPLSLAALLLQGLPDPPRLRPGWATACSMQGEISGEQHPQTSTVPDFHPHACILPLRNLAGRTMAIIPQPLSLLHGPGGLQLDPSTLITYNEEQILVVATLLQERLRCQLGLSLRVQQAAVPSTPSLHLQLCAVVEELSSHPQGEEGYVLTVTASSGAVVAAASRQGLLYGAQSLAQLLLPVATAGGEAAASEQQQQQQQFYLPAVRVVDAPRFRWRGLMLDCGRHFLSVPFILRVLDLMLLYRFNRLHWHLCEDQVCAGWQAAAHGDWRAPLVLLRVYVRPSAAGAGVQCPAAVHVLQHADTTAQGWRLEVKQFPRLTEVGAWREGAEDKQRYGGYYTQEQVGGRAGLCSCHSLARCGT